MGEGKDMIDLLYAQTTEKKRLSGLARQGNVLHMAFKSHLNFNKNKCPTENPMWHTLKETIFVSYHTQATSKQTSNT